MTTSVLSCGQVPPAISRDSYEKVCLFIHSAWITEEKESKRFL